MLSRSDKPWGNFTAKPEGTLMYWPNPPDVFMPRSKPMTTSGGFGQYISVPSGWAVKLPQGLSLRDSMGYGTAGLTAALSLLRLMAGGLNKDSGEVLVTGATGGVCSIALAVLSQLRLNGVA